MNPVQLDKYKLTIQNVADAITANNSGTGGNVIKSGASQLSIRSVGRITKAEDIEQIVLAAQNGVPITVKDVASVEIGVLPPSGIFSYTDKDRGIDNENGVEGIVQMRRGENPSEVLQNIKEKIAELNNGLLPKGVQLIVTYDRQDLVDNTLETVSRTIFEGITIVTIILVFFLGNLRAALAVAMTIPLSMLFAFFMMKMTGIPANLLSLGGIDFGIIVDSAIVMVESISRHISHASDEEKKKGVLRLIFISASEVQRQIFFAVVIIVLAYLPLFTLQRVEGKLFSPTAYTFSYAVFGSMLLALTVVPVVCSFLFTKKYKEWENPAFGWLEKHYRTLMAWVLQNAKVAIGIGVVAVVIGIGLGTTIGTEYLPELDEGLFTIRCNLPAGVSLEEANTYPKIIRREIAKFEEVKFVLVQLGRNDDGTDPYGPNRMEIHVNLRPYKTWKSGKVKKDLLVEIKHALETAMPGQNVSFSQPILDNVTEAATGSASDLAVIISGSDLVQLRQLANSVYGIIKNIPGAADTGFEQEGTQTQLVIQVNRKAAARYGINTKDVDNIVDLAIAGKPISQVYEGDRKFDIALRYTKDNRSTPEAISNILITTSTGAKVPLSEIAEVKMVAAQTIIAREEGRRLIAVKTNIRGRDQGGFVDEAQKAINAKIKLPENYDIKWGGQFENLTRAKNRLLVVIPVTLLLIFLVLFLLFGNSAKYAAIVMTNMPFALIGGILALVVRNINFSVSAGVGFVSLFGISVMSGVLLISYINILRVEKLVPLKEAVLEGAITQFRPRVYVMTVALIGLIPAARATGIGSDIQRPLASVIVGGLLSAMVLTVIVTPAIYYLIEKRSLEKQAAKKSDTVSTTIEDDVNEVF
jgi:cobalt-zinc-cadmium resistance protein CzcA